MFFISLPLIISFISFQSGKYNCNICKSSGNGYVFHCSACKYDCHPHCGIARNLVNHGLKKEFDAIVGKVCVRR